MDNLITAVTGVSAYVIGIVSQVAAVIIAQPILLIPLGLGLLGSGVALFKHLR